MPEAAAAETVPACFAPFRQRVQQLVAHQRAVQRTGVAAARAAALRTFDRVDLRVANRKPFDRRNVHGYVEKNQTDRAATAQGGPPTYQPRTVSS